MNIEEIAAKLVAMRETQMTAFVMTGVLREELGFEGYGEALRRRWIQADEEMSGMVQITNNLGVIAEMRALAEEFKLKAKCKCNGETCKCGCKEGKCSCPGEKSMESIISEMMDVGIPRTPVPSGPVTTWERFLPRLQQYFRTDPQVAKNAQSIGVTPDELFKQHEAEMRKQFEKTMTRRRAGGMSPVESPGYGQSPIENPDYPMESLREAAHMLAQGHAFRQKQTLAEIATLGLGRQPDSAGTPIVGLGAQSAQPAAPAATAPVQAPNPASPSSPQMLGIGADVRVVEAGKTYVGKVSQVKPDGKMQISFGGEKPANVRDYDKSEVSPADATRQ